MEIFRLFGSIFIKSEDAERSVQKVNDTAAKLPAVLGKGITTAVKWGAALVASAGIAVTAMVGFATNAASAADEVDKMSQKIGLSIEGYQEWAYVMGQNGMEIDKLQTGMKTLVQQMDSAASGSVTAQENFDRLGVSIYDANGGLKDQETIMNEVLRALADMENGTEKARLATELFGKSGTEMMPMLNQGAEAIDELTNRAHELGLIMSEETVAAGVTLGDLMDDVKQSFSQIAVSLGSALFPAIQMITELILENVPMINGMVLQMIPVMESALMAVVPLFLRMAQDILPELLVVVSEVGIQLLPLVSEILPILTELLLILIPPLAELLPHALGILVPKLVEMCNFIQVYLIPAVEMLAEWFGPMLGATFTNAGIAIQGFLDVFNGVMNSVIAIAEYWLAIFTGDWEGAWEATKKFFIGIWDTIVGMLKMLVPDLIRIITENWDKISSFFLNAWNWCKNAFSTAKNFVSNVFSTIVSTVTSKITSAVQFVKNGIDKIKSFFNFQWSLPKLKMPHFRINGSFSLDPLQVPTFGVDWYAKAMDSPVIMNKPTAFGINEIGQIMAGGEAGSEVVSGTDTLMNMIATVVANQNNGMEKSINDGFAILMAFLQHYMPALANMKVVMNTGALVGELTPGINESLGELITRERRGV